MSLGFDFLELRARGGKVTHSDSHMHLMIFTMANQRPHTLKSDSVHWGTIWLKKNENKCVIFLNELCTNSLVVLDQAGGFSIQIF